MKVLKKLTPLFVLAFWIGVWFGISAIIGNSLLFPNPWQVLKTIGILFTEENFYLTILLSFRNIFIGILSAIILAILLVFATSKSELIRKIILPFMSVIKATPVASLIILFLVFLGNEKVPSVITFLIVLPIVWTNLDTGVKNIDKSLLEVTKVFCFTKRKTFKALILPSIKPYFLSACKSAIGIAWKAGIAAEVIARSKNTIGYAISDAKQYIETERVFAWTVIVVLLSVALEKLLTWLFSRLNKEEKV